MQIMETKLVIEGVGVVEMEGVKVFLGGLEVVLEEIAVLLLWWDGCGKW